MPTGALCHVDTLQEVGGPTCKMVVRPFQVAVLRNVSIWLSQDDIETYLPVSTRIIKRSPALTEYTIKPLTSIL